MQIWICSLANLDLHPCKSGFALLLHHEVDGVVVGSPLSATFDFDERAVLKFGDGATDGRHVGTHVFGQAFLSRKAQVVVPGIGQQERVDDLGVGRDLRVAQNKVRQLREAVTRDGIARVEPHVLLDRLQLRADVVHASL